jgi:rhodanese-related sulfurtransferase
MAEELHDHLRRHNVSLHLGDRVTGFDGRGGALTVRTSGGAAIEADLVILAIGVRPEVTLARDAGLALGKLGGVRVDEQMRTSDPAIWAVGDMVEVRDFVTGAWSLIPLAGPANRQGRLAAESIAGRPRPFRGVQGTAVCGLFGVTAALTGATEKSLQRAGISDYERVYLHPGHHVAYYPGARPIHLKLLFERETGRVLGAQAVGEEGVEKRIDVLAMAIQKGATVFDLEEAELCYAPQFGAAKDPVNVAGMVASNVVRGDVALARWEDLAATQALILDVREAAEHAAGSISGAVNLPLSALRSRIDELPRDREIWIHCAAGQRSYYAARFLAQNGFRVKNLPGGYKTYQMFRPRT